ncbi:hypothetical protein [uncultured Gammaproteobacteria bacterium]|nr:hypothetical protein [uncultured Gammaproteobacteria bacterium]
MNKKKMLDDIFNDDDFGLLDLRAEVSNVKSEEDRVIDAFKEINIFIEQNQREPNATSMSEYRLHAILENFKKDEAQKRILKPFDKHNLLGYVKKNKPTIDDILNEKNVFGLLDLDKNLDVFKFNHTPKSQDRAEADLVAQRTSLKEEEFKKYEKKFQKVHQELKNGKRKIKTFKNVGKHLREGCFYLLDGVLLYLEKVDFKNLGENTFRGKDGRTRIIFENATFSNMLYRSLGKSLYNNGQIVTDLGESQAQELFVETDSIKEEDILTGYIYILQSKSNDLKITNIKNLYKIGFSSTPVEKRIKNAKNEATYLFADVKIIATYQIYNRNAIKLEGLLHKFFSNACLNIDLFDSQGQRITPREWFIVPIKVINRAIDLILSGCIVSYEYDPIRQLINDRS